MPVTELPPEYFGDLKFTRKAISVFMDWLIEKIYVKRLDDQGNVYAYIRPPVQYANIDRVHTVIKDVHNNKFVGNTNVTVNNILPRISVNALDISYSSERKINKFHKVRGNTVDNENTINRIMTPAPYKLEVELGILTKSIDDSFQIIEQVLPYFTPHYSFEVDILPNYDPEMITYTLNSVVPESADEYGAIDARVFMSTLNFTVDLNYYYLQNPPTKVVREIITNYHLQKDEDYKKWIQYTLTETSLAPVVEMKVEDMIFETEIIDDSV